MAQSATVSFTCFGSVLLIALGRVASWVSLVAQVLKMYLPYKYTYIVLLQLSLYERVDTSTGKPTLP